jgi:PAS domain S-box-containing protein
MMTRLQSTPARIGLLTALYILAGKLGLLLAIPPGYSTITWPPAGIAVGLMLVGGSRLWPGVLLGSFVLNAFPAAWAPGHDIDAQKAWLALVIASGSTLQALAARALIVRFQGLPLRFSRVSELVKLFALAGPCACLVSSTIGVTALFLSGAIGVQQIADNWLVWWGGDFFGVVVFMPIMLAVAGREHRLVWRGTPVGGRALLVMLALLIPLAITVEVWKVNAERLAASNQNAFESLVLESENMLGRRMSVYQQVLRGAAAYVLSSPNVAREDWRRYVQNADIDEALPGVSALGYVEARDGGKAFIVKYIEPEEPFRRGIGFDLAQEPLRREAAQISRDTGKPALTRKLVLRGAKEPTSTPASGILMLHPLYTPGLPTSTVQERNEAIRGWLYAPLGTTRFMQGLTRSQGELLNVSLYDGPDETPDAMIYSGVQPGEPVGAFRASKAVQVLNRTWLVVWTSTPAFDAEHQGSKVSKVLLGGLLISTLLGMLVLISTARSLESVQWMAAEKGYLAPLFVLVIFAGASFYVYHALDRAEQHTIEGLVAERAEKTRALIDAELSSRLTSFKRMAQRWESAGGTPEDQWRNDASSYLNYRPGLKSLHWVDADGHVRWTEPNTSRPPTALLPERGLQEPWLIDSLERSLVVTSPPFELDPENRGFVIYAPLVRRGRPDGFIAAFFNAREFFADIATNELARDFSVVVRSGDAVAWESRPVGAPLDARFGYVGHLGRGREKWSVSVRPTTAFTDASATWLPVAGLSTGLLVALLLAFTLRAMIVARLRTAYLAKSNEALGMSEETFRSAMQSASIGMALVTPDGQWLKVNPAVCTLLGYTEQEFLQRNFQALTHPDDLEADMRLLRDTLAGHIDRYRMEKRFLHKSGRIVWGLLSVALVRDGTGRPNYFVSQIQDITEQKEVERLKNEFISVVSHELRTPLTAIRGSIGLALGPLAEQLTEQTRRLLAIADNNCERLILLINDILDVDRIASGRMRFDLKDHSVAQLVRNAVEVMQPYAQRFEVRIDVEAIDPAIRVKVDDDRVIQVLSNLLSNAAKFSPPRAIVRVFAELSGNRVRVSVKDTGIGIADSFRSRIFEKFSQADASSTRRASGTGLGLNIARQMVERMDGQIGFESTVDEGSTFWVELPMVEVASPVSLAL